MGRIRPLIASIAVPALLALGVGCKGTNSWKTPEGVPSAPLSLQVKPERNPVVQAGGTSPFTSLPSSLSWITGKTGNQSAKGRATEIAVAWRNHIDYLPDPTHQGAMGPGLVGQMFLFDSRDYPAIADGTLTVDLYDETPRPAGQPGMKPERWQFRKDVLTTLRTVDERFGPNYVLFLPWPSCRPDITHVRITVRFDSDQKGAFTLYAPESKLTLDATRAGKNEIGGGPVQTPPPQFGDVSPAGGPTTSASPTSNASGGPAPSALNSPGFGPIRLSRPATQSASANGSAGLDDPSHR